MHRCSAKRKHVHFQGFSSRNFGAVWDALIRVKGDHLIYPFNINVVVMGITTVTEVMGTTMQNLQDSCSVPAPPGEIR